MARPSAMQAAVAAVLLLAPALVAGHGFLMVPVSRNYGVFLGGQAFNGNFTVREWLLHELNGGGIKFISHSNTIGWPSGRGSMCGDPWNRSPKQWMQPGPVRATYRAGDIINITTVPTTNHEGFYEFRVCPLDAQDATQCRLLERCAPRPGLGPAGSRGRPAVEAALWRPPAAAVAGRRRPPAAAARPPRRADGKGPRWYLPAPKCCDKGGRDLVPSVEDGFADWGNYSYNDEWRHIPIPTTPYRLPADLNCEHCMLQWWAAAAAPPCHQGRPVLLLPRPNPCPCICLPCPGAERPRPSPTPRCWHPNTHPPPPPPCRYWLTGHRCVPRCEPANPYYKVDNKTCDPSKMGFCGVDKRQYPVRRLRQLPSACTTCATPSSPAHSPARQPHSLAR
jgi:hypothetical protein